MKSLVQFLLLALWLTVAFAVAEVSLFKKYPDSCTAAKPKKNGIVKIQVNGSVYSVYCDVKTTGLPWLVIQRRECVDVNFYRNYSSYQQGFGDLNRDFFIGLDTLNALTAARVHKLYIHLEDFEGQSRYAEYNQFAIGNMANAYGLNVLGDYSGTAGDGLFYHKGYKFSTFDRDNGNSTTNKDDAVHFTGAWWYRQSRSHYSHLNGLYLGGEYSRTLTPRGMTWYPFRGDYYSLKKVQMMIRPLY